MDKGRLNEIIRVVRKWCYEADQKGYSADRRALQEAADLLASLRDKLPAALATKGEKPKGEKVSVDRAD